MLRNFVRTSHRLVRKQINTLPTVIKTGLKPLKYTCALPNRQFTTKQPEQLQSTEYLDPAVFEEVCSETLESLCEFFEELIEDNSEFKGADVTYSVSIFTNLPRVLEMSNEFKFFKFIVDDAFKDGVLTVALGSHGTYVINRQTPNKQIWLSSPLSGPKRYDLVMKNGGYWVYKHDGVTLHQLLQKELTKIVSKKVDLKNCSHNSI